MKLPVLKRLIEVDAKKRCKEHPVLLPGNPAAVTDPSGFVNKRACCFRSYLLSAE